MAVISPFDAHVARKALVGHELNGELSSVSELLRPLLRYMGSLSSVEQRAIAWEGYLYSRADRDGVVKALAEADPSGPPPEAEKPFRFATLADVRRVQSQIRWLWEGWIPASRIVGLAAFEGVGKTRLAADLARRIHQELPWPDGQAPTFPVGTRTAWICSDAHHDELPEIAAALDLPDDAIIFPTSSDDPYGNTDLDSLETLANLERCIAEEKPGLVFIDTLTSATSVDLCDQRSIKPLKAKLAPLVQVYGVSIILLLHLSREGQALGRRIKGLTRTLMHLECPDPEHPERLRFWVEKSYAKKPPALGCTITSAGNTYDFNPPKAPERNQGGRPSAACDKAQAFIRDALAREDGLKAAALCADWEKGGGSHTSFWRARDALVASGEITCDGKPYVLRRVATDEPVNF